MDDFLDKKILKKVKWGEMIDLTHIILALVAAGGFIFIVSVAPNVLQIVNLYQKWQKTYKRRNYVNGRLESLIKKGLLRVVKNEGRRCLELTKKGELELEKYRTVNNILKKKWDGRWRVVIFDIWEKRRNVRDQLRMELRELGFQKMQNSVWVSPYDCGDFIYLLKTDLSLGRAIAFFEVVKLENEKYWRKKFGLE